MKQFEICREFLHKHRPNFVGSHVTRANNRDTIKMTGLIATAFTREFDFCDLDEDKSEKV